MDISNSYMSGVLPVCSSSIESDLIDVSRCGELIDFQIAPVYLCPYKLKWLQWCFFLSQVELVLRCTITFTIEVEPHDYLEWWKPSNSSEMIAELVLFVCWLVETSTSCYLYEILLKTLASIMWKLKCKNCVIIVAVENWLHDQLVSFQKITTLQFHCPYVFSLSIWNILEFYGMNKL